MHELGLARAIAGAIRENGWQHARLEVRVTDAHASPADFDAALLAHLKSEEPDLETGRVTIVHFATPRVCSHCATQFEPVEDAEGCPACGGPPLPGSAREEVELMLLAPEDAPCV